MEFEMYKSYKVVKKYVGFEVGHVFRVGYDGLSVNTRGNLVAGNKTLATHSRLIDGYLVEDGSKMTLDEIVNSKETFVAVRHDGASIMYSNGLFGGFDKTIGCLKVFTVTDADFNQWVADYAKEIYLAADYPDGKPVWTAESEEDVRKREQLEKLGKDIEVLTESYNKLKDELK